MAHGNDPSLPHEVAACTTLEVVYEGCTAALACQPISSSLMEVRGTPKYAYLQATLHTKHYRAQL